MCIRDSHDTGRRGLRKRSAGPHRAEAPGGDRPVSAAGVLNGPSSDRAAGCFDRLWHVDGYLFSGYARLPQDVSHQNLHRRVGLVIEVDEHGVEMCIRDSTPADRAAAREPRIKSSG